MSGFSQVAGPALVLREDRTNTDILFPARFLLIMEKQGLGRYLFYDRRFDGAGAAIPNPIDAALTAGAAFLIAGADFGCGSSREHAVWALRGAGIRCIIAESFGEIFEANCLRNGLLAITFSKATIDMIALAAEHHSLAVSLRTQRLTVGRIALPFDVDPGTRQRLLNGWDEIDMIASHAGEAITRFEARQRAAEPWLYL